MVSKINSLKEVFTSAVLTFLEDVCKKFEAKAHGEPEEQLKAPLENLFKDFSSISAIPLTLKGQSQLAGRVGKPDYAVHHGITPIGYIELKAPGKGADSSRFTGHDRRQWEIFKNLPNILYTDGDCWALYRNGERIGGMLRLEADLSAKEHQHPQAERCAKLFDILATFVKWEPAVPSSPKLLAAFLAPYCRLLRDAVLESLNCNSLSINRLKGELEALLFPGATDEQFADSYAQTVIFALLLARMEGANTLDTGNAVDQLGSGHMMLSRCLQFLTDTSVRQEINTALLMVCRVIAAIDISKLNTSIENDADEPWLFFYEHFLAAYDPELRKKAGAYYTPIEVVRCQIRLVDKILVEEFGKPMGFLEPLITLDPATGTGTYLLAIVEYALARAKKEEGKGAVRGAARSLANTLCGFEWLVGPYAVAQLRLTQALTRHGVALSSYGPRVYLTNTLASPTKVPPAPSLFHDPIAREYNMAREIKDVSPVIVILGNPPYGRHSAGNKTNRAATGAWVRYGNEESENGKGKDPILEDFLRPARQAGLGIHLANIYNQYVYFIRWALWKAFEHERADVNGIVTFITASSYLDGKAFVGLRRHMRKVCERIDIIDLGGDGRGTHKEENVFDIQTPVCIFFAWRKKSKDLLSPYNEPAKVQYLHMTNTKIEKQAYLNKKKKKTKLPWHEVS
ncbi:MAG: N-6 DNA methylase, partial [Holophagales bacterium]|nr:N-6 DNA methylase [Holophagales bacterium]